MRLSLPTRLAFLLYTLLVLAFLYIPLAVVARLSFNPVESLSWPPKGWTLDWWRQTWETDGPRDALWNSVKVASVATGIAMVMGTLAAFAMQRFSFYGKNAVSFLMVLPIALPGIVTGMALNAAFRTVGFDFGMMTIIIGHATFCVVLVYNNVLARARRISGNLEEASMDLGADQVQTFRHVTFPAIRTALLAGGLLAFALSFDEVIVTTFTTGGGERTIPIWILQNYTRTTGLPIVNAVALILILLSVIPVYFAQRLAGAEATATR
jgi:putative spermidine/putrescine transport system permease protein